MCGVLQLTPELAPSGGRGVVLMQIKTGQDSACSCITSEDRDEGLERGDAECVFVCVCLPVWALVWRARDSFMCTDVLGDRKQNRCVDANVATTLFYARCKYSRHVYAR